MTEFANLSSALKGIYSTSPLKGIYSTSPLLKKLRDLQYSPDYMANTLEAQVLCLIDPAPQPPDLMEMGALIRGLTDLQLRTWRYGGMPDHVLGRIRSCEGDDPSGGEAPL